MYILGNFITALAEIFNMILTMYMWIIIIRALLSWVNPDPYNPIVQALYRITEPVLSYIRQRLPISNVGIDFSPIVVFLIIMFLQKFLVATLAQTARYMY